MTSKPFIFYQGTMFGGLFILTCILILLFAGMVMYIPDTFFVPVLLVLIILSSFRKGLEFDKEEQQYRSYISVLSVKLGKFKPYRSIESIYLEKNEQYAALIRIDQNTLKLLESKDKESLIKEVTPLATYLTITIL